LISGFTHLPSSFIFSGDGQRITGVTHLPPTSSVSFGQMHEPGIGPGCIGAGHMQMPSAFATCGGVQTGGGGGETGTHGPPAGPVPVKQTQMPSALSTIGDWHIGPHR
jgi:hypothetical protein